MQKINKVNIFDRLFSSKAKSVMFEPLNLLNCWIIFEFMKCNKLESNNLLYTTHFSISVMTE